MCIKLTNVLFQAPPLTSATLLPIPICHMSLGIFAVGVYIYEWLYTISWCRSRSRLYNIVEIIMSFIKIEEVWERGRTNREKSRGWLIYPITAPAGWTLCRMIWCKVHMNTKMIGDTGIIIMVIFLSSAMFSMSYVDFFKDMCYCIFCLEILIFLHCEFQIERKKEKKA